MCIQEIADNQPLGNLPMRVKLEVIKAGKRLHEGVYEIDDKASFGNVVWRCVGESPRAMRRQSDEHRRSHGFDARKRDR